jgi:hypothetical protein
LAFGGRPSSVLAFVVGLGLGDGYAGQAHGCQQDAEHQGVGEFRHGCLLSVRRRPVGVALTTIESPGLALGGAPALIGAPLTRAMFHSGR